MPTPLAAAAIFAAFFARPDCQPFRHYAAPPHFSSLVFIFDFAMPPLAPPL